jgi:Na+-transporting methylmalonyl-CoA/oxaloacetate decarboxylase beta subunit
MHAMGANAAGQVASVVAGGVLLALMGGGGH